MIFAKQILSAIFIYTVVSSINGQGLPSTSISVFTLDLSANEVISEPKYITDFNPNGYNNQPAFFDNDILYITSDWKANGQTDLIKLNLKSESLLKVTDTPDSEYSPTLTPDKDGISCISVPPGESDNPTQWLWKYPINRENSGNAVSYDFENVGYHCWISRNLVAIFLVGDPHQLIIYNTDNGEITDVDKNVGRCLRLNSEGRLVYVHKAAHNIWYMKTYDVATAKKNIIGETKTGSEDFEILNEGYMIMGQGSKLFILRDIGGWSEIADLNKYNVKNISRLAILNNKIAVVHAS